MQYTLDQIPIDRLTASDIKQQAGGIAAIVVLVIVLVIVALNQVRVARTTGWLPYYLGWYILGGLVILVLSQLPGLTLRLWVGHRPEWVQGLRRELTHVPAVHVQTPLHRRDGPNTRHGVSDAPEPGLPGVSSRLAVVPCYPLGTRQTPS